MANGIVLSINRIGLTAMKTKSGTIANQLNTLTWQIKDYRFAAKIGILEMNTDS